MHEVQPVSGGRCEFRAEESHGGLSVASGRELLHRFQVVFYEAFLFSYVFVCTFIVSIYFKHLNSHL